MGTIRSSPLLWAPGCSDAGGAETEAVRRIDSLGIDENGSPVVVEYKRGRDAGVITQGLFYLSWLVDHKAEFQHLVREPPTRSCGALPG
ncbi:hypothetical protein [Streptomyces sp. NPDC056401]|uniref:hypothetical protein n=1 Tax=Streptomyces sp. NPDC056401 TaxID=3345809 RepID=UPI0035DBE0FF